MSRQYTRLQSEAPAGGTPPTATKRPVPPAPPIGEVDEYQRTSAYMDALEQLRDEEVLSDQALRKAQAARKSSRTRRPADGDEQPSAHEKAIRMGTVPTLLRAVSAFGKLRSRSASPAVAGDASSAEAVDAAAPPVQRSTSQYKQFVDADDERIVTDHRLQDSLHGALISFLRAPQKLTEVVFLLLLGILAALLATLIAESRAYLTHFRDAVAEAATAFAGGAGGIVVYWLISLAYASVALLACLPAPHGPGSRHAVGSGIPEIKAILSGYWLARYLSARALVAKLLGLTTALAAGFAIGREGPMVHLCAALSTQLMKLPIFGVAIDENVHKKRSMLAAAAAVGVVATFGTPMGGVLFSVEVTATFYMVSNLWRGFVGAIACVIVFQGLTDLKINAVPETDIPYVPHIGWEYLAFAGLGVLCGLLSGLIVKSMAYLVRTLKANAMLRPGTRRFATCLGVCTLSVLYTYALPLNSMEDADQILADLFMPSPLHTRAGHEHDWSLCHTDVTSGRMAWREQAWYCHTSVALAVFCAIELLLMLLSITMPIPSGVVMPLFTLGASFGRMYGVILRTLVGYSRDDLSDAVFAVVGASALTAGTTQTLSTALITIELTGQQVRSPHNLPCLLTLSPPLSHGFSRLLWLAMPLPHRSSSILCSSARSSPSASPAPSPSRSSTRSSCSRACRTCRTSRRPTSTR